MALACLAIACGRSSLPDSALDGDSGPQININGDDGGDATNVLVLGQSSATHNNLEDGMAEPVGIAICGGRLFVADAINSRVLIWSTLPARGPPDHVLGQPDLSTGESNYNGVVDAQGLSSPFAVACNDNLLAITDTTNSRVLLWSPLPTENFAPATVVVGQPDFATSTTGFTDATRLNVPTGVALCGTMLCVADTNNNRVVCWSQIPTVNGASADTLIGQPNFASAEGNNGGLSAASLFYPGGIAGTPTSLFVADRQNRRVLVYPKPLVQATNTASFVLGQSDFASSSQIEPATDSSIETPNGVSLLDDGTLVVAEGAASRIMVYKTAIAANNQSADLLIGAKPTTSDPTNWSPLTLTTPSYATADARSVYVTDTGANRVMVFERSSLASSSSAVAVLGQATLTTGVQDAPGQPIDASAIGGPSDVVVTNGRVVVTDIAFNRILIWNAIPVVSGAPADVVLGQESAAGFERTLTPSIATLHAPSHATVVSGNLVVTDPGNDRVVVYSGIPTTTGTPAAYEIGQADPTQAVVPPTVTATSVSNPFGVDSDGTRLLLADASENRVLIWNTLPPNASTGADVVLGQPDKVTGTTVPPSKTSLALPFDACFAGNGIVVADTGNNRVLIWNIVPSSDGAPADVVLGQSSFTTSASRTLGPTNVQPRDVAFNNGVLYVSTLQGILVWRALPTTNDTPADLIIGQPDFAHDAANNGAIGPDTLYRPGGIGFAADGSLLIADQDNARVVVRAPPAP